MGNTHMELWEVKWQVGGGAGAECGVGKLLDAKN